MSFTAIFNYSPSFNLSIDITDVDVARPQVYIVFSPLHPSAFYIGSTYRWVGADGRR